MEASRSTQGMLLAALAMLLCAWFFDSPAALFPSIFICGLLACRAALLLRGARYSAATVSVHRTANPAFLRQGGMVAAVTTVCFSVPPGMTGRAADLPPQGAPVVQGQACTPELGGGDHSVTLKYGVSCIPSGNITWRGLDLVLRDPFFCVTVPFRNEAFRQPVLRVEPAGKYRKQEGSGIYGERDLERLTVLKGSGIRSFRDYVAGDDPRSIDWKLSAKHGKLFVREYTGVSGRFPILVVDLPDSAVSCPKDLLDAVLGAALHTARDMSSGPEGCSLMIISGANLLSFMPEERSVQKIERALSEFHSPQRAVQCFRTLDPVAAEALRLRLAADEGAHSDLRRRLLEIYSGFIPEIRPIPFDIQCARALGRRSGAALHVLTTGIGDPSHLATLGLYARRMGVEANLGLPDSMACPATLRKLRGAGYTITRVA